MKLIYILSSAHSGSTILDLTLGANPPFCSSGEQRYLPWQLERTATSGGSLEQQTICTCLKQFRECGYWKNVFEIIRKKTDIDICTAPRRFPISFFGKFAYKDLGSFPQRVAGKLARHLLQLDVVPRRLAVAPPHLSAILKNNWILYEAMAEASGRPFVVDSSKDITRALLLHKDRPDKIVFLFISRGVYGYVNSMMNQGLSLEEAVRRKDNYSAMVNQVKRNVKGLNYYEISYESFVKYPVQFLTEFCTFLDIPADINEQMKNGILDTRTMHLVAGNPTRYRGKMQLRLDEKWRNSLTEQQIMKINRLTKHS